MSTVPDPAAAPPAPSATVPAPAPSPSASAPAAVPATSGATNQPVVPAPAPAPAVPAAAPPSDDHIPETITVGGKDIVISHSSRASRVIVGPFTVPASGKIDTAIQLDPKKVAFIRITANAPICVTGGEVGDTPEVLQVSPPSFIWPLSDAEKAKPPFGVPAFVLTVTNPGSAPAKVCIEIRTEE